MAKQKEPIYQSTCFYDKNFQLIRQPLVQQGQKQFPAIKYALLMLVTAIGIYVINFSLWPFVDCINSNGFSECEWYGFSSKRDEWGQFGDFVGGLVNPFIGLLTIYLLVTTISQQSRALDQTEIALDHANKALEQNASALELTRTEIQIAQSEIKIGREIQRDTEAALKEQINVAREQNNFANYYKHLEEFMIHFREWNSKYSTIQFGIHERRLHLYLYPKSNTGNRDTNKAIVRKFLAVLIEYIEMFDLENYLDLDDLQKIPEKNIDFDERIGSIFESKVNFEKERGTDFSKYVQSRKSAPDAVVNAKSFLNKAYIKLKAISDLLSFDVNLSLNDDLVHVFSVLDECVLVLDLGIETDDILMRFNDEKERLVFIKTVLNTKKSSFS